ncbi:MAG: aldehyde dehydrogenase family protein [Hyphomicrobiales bacterium]
MHEASRDDVARAVAAAKSALTGPWGRMGINERVDLLFGLVDGINKRFNDFLEAECADTGKPMSLASHVDIPRGAAGFKIFADIIKNVGSGVLHDGDARRRRCDQLRAAPARTSSRSSARGTCRCC